MTAGTRAKTLGLAPQASTALSPRMSTNALAEQTSTAMALHAEGMPAISPRLAQRTHGHRIKKLAKKHLFEEICVPRGLFSL